MPWRKRSGGHNCASVSFFIYVVSSRAFSSRTVVFSEDPARMMRSARKPGPNDRVVELRKPLGIILEEDERGNVYVKDLQAGGNAAKVRGNQ